MKFVVAATKQIIIVIIIMKNFISVVAVEQLPPSQMSSWIKLDHCEGASFSTAIFNSDIQLSVYSLLCDISICPRPAITVMVDWALNINYLSIYLFVRLSLCQRQRMPKIRTLFCLGDIKQRSFLTSCWRH